MRDVLRWIVIGGSALWLLAGFGAWREGLDGSELLDQAPLLVWVPRLVGIAWIWLMIGSVTVWRGKWVWPETLAIVLMLVYPVGFPGVLYVALIVALWGGFRLWRRQATA